MISWLHIFSQPNKQIQHHNSLTSNESKTVMDANRKDHLSMVKCIKKNKIRGWRQKRKRKKEPIVLNPQLGVFHLFPLKEKMNPTAPKVFVRGRR